MNDNQFSAIRQALTGGLQTNNQSRRCARWLLQTAAKSCYKSVLVALYSYGFLGEKFIEQQFDKLKLRAL